MAMWHFQNSQIKNYEIKINDQKRRTNVIFVERIKMKCGNTLYILIYLVSRVVENVRASLMNFSGILRAPFGRTLSLPMLIFAVNVIIIMYQVITGKYGNSPMSMKIKLK